MHWTESEGEKQKQKQNPQMYVNQCKWNDNDKSEPITNQDLVSGTIFYRLFYLHPTKNGNKCFSLSNVK